MTASSLVSRHDALHQALARAALYSLPALGFARPTPEVWGPLRDVVLPAARQAAPVALRPLLHELGGVAPARPAELAPHHLRLFPPMASQDAPAHETAYRGDDLFRQVDLLADVAGFYRAHGLRAGGSQRERPDHVTVELEFLALVARKEALALSRGEDEAAEVCRETAMAFLGDHLACWAPGFGRRAARVATHGWYRELGHFLAGWVEADAEAVGVVPAEVAVDPLPPPPPDPGGCGPCPTGGPR